MKHLNKISLLRSAFVLDFTVLAGVPTYAQSADMPMAAMDKKTMKTDMADRCQAMMAQQEKCTVGIGIPARKAMRIDPMNVIRVE